MPALDMRGVRFDRRDDGGSAFSLRDIDLQVAPGEVLALVGPSGCGKTTCLRLVAGLERLNGGEIRIAGNTVADARRHLDPERRRVGITFQDQALFPHLDVAANVAFGLRGLKAPQRRQRVDDLLTDLDLADKADAYPHALSGGQRQRVALARALAPNPQLLLLDEPFNGLDAGLRGELRHDLLLMLKRRRTATILVTHDPEEAMYLADRIIVMRQGRIVQQGRPDVIYHAPASSSVARFFGEVNDFTHVHVEAGRLRTPLGDLRTNLPEGTCTDIAVRPEHIRLVAAGSSDAATCGDVIVVRPLGLDSRVEVGLAGGRTVAVRLGGGEVPVAGARVGLALKSGFGHVFKRH